MIPPELLTLSSGAFKLAYAISTFASGRPDCDPTNQQLAKITGMSDSSIKRALDELESSGWLRRQPGERGIRVLVILWAQDSTSPALVQIEPPVVQDEPGEAQIEPASKVQIEPTQVQNEPAQVQIEPLLRDEEKNKNKTRTPLTPLTELPEGRMVGGWRRTALPPAGPRRPTEEIAEIAAHIRSIRSDGYWENFAYNTSSALAGHPEIPVACIKAAWSEAANYERRSGKTIRMPWSWVIKAAQRFAAEGLPVNPLRPRPLNLIDLNPIGDMSHLMNPIPEEARKAKRA